MKKFAIITGAVLAGAGILYLVFALTYTTVMKEEHLKSRSIGGEHSKKKILVLGRGSSYKRALIQKLEEGLIPESPEQNDLKMDIKDIRSIDPEKQQHYDAIVLLSSTNNQSHHPNVHALLNHIQKEKVVALSTSTMGTPEHTPPLPNNVEAITSASNRDRLDQDARELIEKTKAVLMRK